MKGVDNHNFVQSVPDSCLEAYFAKTFEQVQQNSVLNLLRTGLKKIRIIIGVINRDRLKKAFVIKYKTKTKMTPTFSSGR